MKRLVKIIILVAFMLITPLLMMAQEPPHPNGGAAPGDENVPVGGGAPIGSGTLILITLAAAYSGRKVYVMHTTAE